MKTTPWRLLALTWIIGALAACGGGESPSEPDADNIDADQDSGDLDDVIVPDTTPSEGTIRCNVNADCDDGLDCTIDRCEETESRTSICTWEVFEDQCLINGVCYADGDANPDDPCRACDAEDALIWSALPDGMGCNDGNACTEQTYCDGGVCTGGEPVSCDDGNACSVDTCLPDEGCVSTTVPDGAEAVCDDGDPCTTDDLCVDGVCAGLAASCDDGDPCTDDACGADGECLHTPNTATCDDGDPCTVDDVCSEGVCTAGPPNTCDDGNQCTLDVCYTESGCTNLPTYNPCCIGATSVCDDGDPCTDDFCDPDTAECSYDFNVAPCEDGDACTTDDLCDAGACVGGPPLDCEDGDLCTDDMCNPAVGCTATLADDGTTCDDGLECTTGDICQAGVCTATDDSGCGCVPTFSEVAGKVASVALAANDGEGEAIDIDGDGDRDNALGALGTFVNESLTGTITDGSLMLLLELIDFAPGPFTMAIHNGSLAPEDAACDFQTATCDYLVDASSLDDETCLPIVSLPATYSGGRLAGGSPETNMPFSIAIGDAGDSLSIVIYMVHVAMDATITADDVTTFDGILAGAITQTDLEDAIRAIDPESLPLPADNLISLLGTLAPNDIDTDGDGELDAKSISLLVSGINGEIVGRAE